MACNQYRLNRMLNAGKVIYLEIDAKSVINRLQNTKQKRPVLANLSKEELEKTIHTLLKKRRRYYEQANKTIASLEIKKMSIKEVVF